MKDRERTLTAGSWFGEVWTKVLLAVAVLTAVLLAAGGIGAAAQESRGGTFVVTNTKDSGKGSLRQAILSSNERRGGDTIRFAIPGNGTRTIAVASPLPAITDPVVVDGFSQRGSRANGRETGTNAVLPIEVTGSGRIVGNGFELARGSGGSTIQGLVVNGFNGKILTGTGNGILVESSDNKILGNFLGTTANGERSKPNRASGVFLKSGKGNEVGEDALRSRNVISGNGNGANLRNPLPSLTAGVVIHSDENSVNNNIIGPSAKGRAITTAGRTPRLFQNVGVQVDLGAQNNVVGATTKRNLGNVISGNATRGVLIQDVASLARVGTSGNSVSGNLIGTDLAGDRVLPGPKNREAVQETGIQFRFGAQFNYVGVGPATLNTSPEDLNDSTGFGNTIAFNEDDGILVGGTQEMAEDTTDAALIRFNTIRNNGGVDNIGLGINADAGLSDTPSAFEQQPAIDPNSGTPPYDRNVTNLYDSLDVDTGPNNENNMPVLSSTVLEGNRARVKGDFNSIEGIVVGGESTPTGTEPNSTFVIDFYVNNTIQPQNEDDEREPRACDPSDFGEGETYVGSTTVTTDTFGKAPFDVLLPRSSSVRPGSFIVAANFKTSGGEEITQPPLSSSEFSKCSEVTRAN